MTFPVNLSLWCFRTVALLMVTLNIESRKPTGRVYPENHLKTQNPLGVKGLNSLQASRSTTGCITS